VISGRILALPEVKEKGVTSRSPQNRLVEITTTQAALGYPPFNATIGIPCWRKGCAATKAPSGCLRCRRPGALSEGTAAAACLLYLSLLRRISHQPKSCSCCHNGKHRDQRQSCGFAHCLLLWVNARKEFSKRGKLARGRRGVALGRTSPP